MNAPSRRGLALLAAFALPAAFALLAAGDTVSSDRFTDKLTAGYQAWFTCPADIDGRFVHWSRGAAPAPGNVTFELYPDVSEYDDDALCDTRLGPLGSSGEGEPARLYDSAAPDVIDTHFRWMRQYGIDGAGLQRFAGELYGDKTRGKDVAREVRAAAERHGRIFYVMYDISGGREADWVENIQRDWEDAMVNELGIVDSPRYARQDGKPVVNVWGMGFGDRPGTPAEAEALIVWFQARGVYVAGGVPYRWRELPAMADAYASLDLVQPWAVGTNASAADVDANFAGIVADDVAFTRARDQDYQRVIYPGFAWSNWNGGPPNEIPRDAGEMFWKQAVGTARLGTGAYVAMFDKYDEGTAIAKAAETVADAPNDQYFLTLDADGTRVSADFYLRLAGAANEMIAGRSPLRKQVPVPFDVARLAPGGSLSPDDELLSPDGAYRLLYQRDGNLVLYGDAGDAG